VPATTVPDTRPIDPAPSETRPRVTLPPSGPPTGPVDPPIDREPPPDRSFATPRETRGRWRRGLAITPNRL
jgi:hypothetical protein